MQESYYNIVNLLVFKLKLKRIKKFNNIQICNIPEAGLGNRLNALMFAINFDNPQKIYMVWDSEKWVTAKFSDLFVLNSNITLIELNNLETHINDSGTFIISNPKYKLKDAKQTFELSNINKLSKNFIKTYSNLFQKLEPSSTVKSRIDEQNKVLNGQNYVSIQVRNNSDWNEFGRNENLEKFFEQMNKYPSNTKFYLSAMNIKVANLFKEKFPNRIFELTNKNYKSMIDATADLYLLAKGNEAIYSYGSTFAETAWWLSHAKQKCYVIGNCKDWLR